MESGGSPCPVVDTTKTTNRSLGKRLCTNKQRRHGLACTGRVAARTQVFGAYGIEAVHGEHVDGGAAPSLRLAADGAMRSELGTRALQAT